MLKLKFVLRNRAQNLFAVLSHSAAYATAKLYIKTDLLLILIHYYYTVADPIGRAVKCVGLWPLTGIVGFESC
jgi:hypothetical protein